MGKGEAVKKERRYEALQQAHKRIRLRAQNAESASKIAEEYKLSPVASRILAARGYQADEDLKNFLDPTLKEGLPPPAKLKNLEHACALIKKTIEVGKGVAICCDFDVDGLSGGSQVHHFFQTIGVHSKVFVPDRFEDGYGLNEKMVREIAGDKCFGVMVTIDYGTTNLRELTVARELKLPTIVIDHHHVGDHRPPCDCFVNPQQEGCGFAGGILSAAGLAWYFVVALRGALRACVPAVENVDPRQYLDLACLGTICDLVPLVGANRVIAKRGLELLSASPRPGLIALRSVVGAGAQVSCYDVSFGIGPRLNAAGRMVHGQVVIDLLTTTDQKLAEKVAHDLNRLNLERQDTELFVKERAIEKIQARYQSSGVPAGIVVWDEQFHTGVIGIVAQRLVELYYRPAVVMGLDADGIYKGSVRGIKGFSVVRALAEASEHLIKFGGHEGAGGFSVATSHLDEFSAKFVEVCEKHLAELETTPCADADTEAELKEIDVELVEELKRFAPFGMGNPSPQILVRDLRVVEVKELKSAHLKATLSDGRRYINGLMWRQRAHPALFKGAKVHAVCKPDVNSYKGVTEVQATLQAVELA